MYGRCVAESPVFRTTACKLQGWRSEKNSVGLKRSEGETRIRVLLGANPRKSSNRFLNNYKAEFALKQQLHFVYSTN